VYQCHLQLHLGANAQDDLLQLEQAAAAAAAAFEEMAKEGEGAGMATSAIAGAVAGAAADREGGLCQEQGQSWILEVEVTDHEAVIPAKPFWDMLRKSSDSNSSSSSSKGFSSGLLSEGSCSLLVVLDMERCVRHTCPVL
jgi:hypothetical protein